MPWEAIANVIPMEKGEKILDVSEGNVETSNNGKRRGVLALTNRRIVWLVKSGGSSNSLQQDFEVPLQDIRSIHRTGKLFKSWTVSDSKTEYKFQIRFCRDAMGNDLFRFIIRAAQINDKKTMENYRKKALARAKEVKILGISTGITIRSGKDVTGKYCPKCASSETEEMGSIMSKLYRRTPFAGHRKFRCQKCGYEWKYYFD